MNWRTTTTRILLAAFFVACDIMLFAQPPGGPPPGGGGTTGGVPPCWAPECIPLDGGIGFLLVAGAALGAKKIYNNREKNRA